MEVEMPGAQSRKYRVRIRTANGEYEGLFSSPFPDRRLSEVLTRMDEFINVKEVTDVASKEIYPFMVIAKSSIETIKVIEEWE
jgi:hypothetical protein